MAVITSAARTGFHRQRDAGAELDSLQRGEEVLGGDSIRARMARQCGRRIVEDTHVVASSVDPCTELLDESVEGG